MSRRYTFRYQQELLRFATGYRGRTIGQLAICTFEIYLKFACGLRLMKGEPTADTVAYAA